MSRVIFAIVVGLVVSDVARYHAKEPRMRQTKYAVMLSEEDRAHLRILIGQGTVSARLLTHARSLLKADRARVARPGPMPRSRAPSTSIRPR